VAKGNETDLAKPQASPALARIILFTFLLTFILARVIAFLVMSRRLPDLYMHLGGTHIHHLNYGIFLLAGVGACLLLRRPQGRQLKLTAALYGVGMGLTFDEFGMWVRLGGSYWQRASLDAVAVLTALFGLIAYAPKLRDFRPRHWYVTVGIGLVVGVFFVMLVESFQYARKSVGRRLYQIESTSPP
jgi:hypothetical protein